MLGIEGLMAKLGTNRKHPDSFCPFMAKLVLSIDLVPSDYAKEEPISLVVISCSPVFVGSIRWNRNIFFTTGETKALHGLAYVTNVIS